MRNEERGTKKDTDAEAEAEAKAALGRKKSTWGTKKRSEHGYTALSIDCFVRDDVVDWSYQVLDDPR